LTALKKMQVALAERSHETSKSFCFHLETIPNVNSLFNLTGFSDRDIEAKRTEITRYHLNVTDGKNPFPRHTYHKVVAISFQEAEFKYSKKRRELTPALVTYWWWGWIW